MPVEEWTEADGTIYRLREDGNYDVIPPAKKQKVSRKAKKAKKEWAYSWPKKPIYQIGLLLYYVQP